MKYDEPKMEIWTVEGQDIIRTSTLNGNEGPGDGSDIGWSEFFQHMETENEDSEEGVEK